MMMIDPATSWFNIVEILTYDLDEIMGGNDEYIDKPSTRVIPLFNNAWLSGYSRPLKVVFDNGSKFKLDFTLFLNYFDIKPVLITTKNPQDNVPVERVHQVRFNMLVTKDIDNKIFDHIYPWGENLAPISWAVRASYRRTIMATPGQAVFVKNMIFNLASVVDSREL